MGCRFIVPFSTLFFTTKALTKSRSSPAKFVVRTVQFGSAEPSFASYASFNGKMNAAANGTRKEQWDMKHKPAPKLRKAAQPPLSRPGGAPDSDRAQRPRLAQPPAPRSKLSPGDRVEGLGNFGKPTEEFGTVERTNEEDAVVKWDDDGRTRLHQPWLKKV